jgi:hypothetical protein
MQHDGLTIRSAIVELADTARIYGKRAKAPEERLIWAQAEVELSKLARSMEDQPPASDATTSQAA